MKIHGTATGGALSHKDFGVAFGGGAAGCSYITASGGAESTDGDYKIHKFTADDEFDVTCINADNKTVEYLVIGGGAGGGAGEDAGIGAGGGAGAYRTATGFEVGVETYSITVGDGGSKGLGSGTAAGDGDDSVFSSITASGGGAGGSQSEKNGSNSTGSGGGAAISSGTTGSIGRVQQARGLYARKVI